MSRLEKLAQWALIGAGITVVVFVFVTGITSPRTARIYGHLLTPNEYNEIHETRVEVAWAFSICWVAWIFVVFNKTKK